MNFFTPYDPVCDSQNHLKDQGTIRLGDSHPATADRRFQTHQSSSAIDRSGQAFLDLDVSGLGRVADVLLLVQPDTVIRWHRKGLKTKFVINAFNR